MAATDDELKLSQPRKETDNAPLFVSVYVVILAFFIVLNSISKVDKTKLENLVQSVNETFNMPSKVLTPKEMDNSSLNVSVAEFFSEIQSWVQSIFSVEGLEVLKKGNTMTIRVPASAIFEDSKAVFRKEAEPKVTELANLLISWMKDYRLTAEIVIEIADTGEGNIKVIETLAMDRVNIFAKSLVSQGVNAKNFSPGIAKTTQDFVVFRFSLYPSKAPVKPEAIPSHNKE